MLLTHSNYERKAHHERRQKSAPFSVSQLSPPLHHVFPKPGAVPSAKCTGKHILGPAVIWSWRTGCGWIRNQPIGPGTMWPLVRLQERSLPSAPLPLPEPAFRRVGCQESFCNMPCMILSHQPCAELQLFCVLNDTLLVLWDFGWGLLQPLWKWMHRKPWADTNIYVQAAVGQLWQQRLGPWLLWNPKGWKPPEKLLLISPTEHSVHCTNPSQNQILSGLTTLPMICRLCRLMTFSKHYGNEAMA